MVVHPAMGIWRVTVTAPSTTAFWLNLHAITPFQHDVPKVCRDLLDPLFANPHAPALHAVAFGRSWGDGLLDNVTNIAVGALVGVIVTGAIMFSGGAPFRLSRPASSLSQMLQPTQRCWHCRNSIRAVYQTRQSRCPACPASLSR